MVRQLRRTPAPEPASSDLYPTDDVCLAIVFALANETGLVPMTMEPLYETIDPATIAMFFEDSSDSGVASRRLTFRYHRWMVTVTDGDPVSVTVTPV